MIGAMRGWHGMRKARWWAGESSRCEDPAPTVGICGDIIAIQMLSHCRRHAHTVHPACPHLRRPYGFYNGTPHLHGSRETELRD